MAFLIGMNKINSNKKYAFKKLKGVGQIVKALIRAYVVRVITVTYTQLSLSQSL